MRVSTLIFSGLAGFAAAAPYYPFPLSDGFPKPNAAQLKQIQVLAGGSLPGGSLATQLTADATVTVQLLALNEIFEVAFFTDLLYNITNNVPGYTSFPSSTSRDYVINAITAIQNQEKLHYLGTNAILAAAGKTQIAPCKYNFPVNTLDKAIALANTFTDVVLGVLPMAQTVFAKDGGQETAYVNLVGSILGQEAEQNGWYRSVQKKLPSAAPFLTTEGPAFAVSIQTLLAPSPLGVFSVINSVLGVIAPGCPGVDLVAKSIPTFGKLNVIGKPTNKDDVVSYSVAGKISASQNSLTYLSGQNLPATVPIYDVVYKNGVSTFCAKFPFSTDGFAKGLTIAAVVKKPAKAFADGTAVAAATVYGPGIIEVD